MSIDIFEKAINEVSDKDWSWWPFLWLRPQRHAELSLTRLAAISVLYGLPCGGLVSVPLAIVRPEMRALVPFAMAALPLLFLFLGSMVIAPMWNRRAERIRSGR